MTTDDFSNKVENLGFDTCRGNNTISIKRKKIEKTKRTLRWLESLREDHDGGSD